VLACTYAFNMATTREWLEGHLLPPLLHVLGTRGLAKLLVSQAAKQLGTERADWLAGLMADQDRKLMGVAWRETMAFDSRRRLAEIACPTLVVAASNDRGYRSTTRECCTTASLVLSSSLSMALTTRSYGRTPTSSCG
jgi:pimeloyl-ACP methyl ester carboxylesterase